MLSVIIPAKNEIYLEKTIRNVLANARGEIEIIVELDGYLPNPQIVIGDNRVIFYHHENAIGQRKCINHGATVARGEYIMKLDAHCAVDEGFDIKLAADCDPSWTVVPRMYNLDVTTWKPKLHKITDYMYISSPREDKPFRASYYSGKEYRRQHAKGELIDDTMCCMGPGWFMHKDRFWEQGGCDENHEGGWGQQGIEVSLKAWLSGGALKVNKKTWFAHWFRGGSGPGFPYEISGNQIERVRAYSRDLWLNDKWEKAVRKLDWLVEKFDPPGWKNEVTIIYYTSNRENEEFEKKIIEDLKKKANGIPIISVSQKPMDLGQNICVGPLPFSEKSALFQLLTGLKAAKTKFCLAAESDFIYPAEYFKFIPPTEDHSYRYDNVWVRWRKNPKFFKKYYSEGCQICGREYWIKMIEKALVEDKESYHVFSTKLEYRWGSPNPAVSFKNGRGLHGKSVLNSKVEPCLSLPLWGKCKEFL
jgi:Glycosyltransferases involved in cell wall biogenesis